MSACVACGFDASQTKLDLSTRPKRGRIKARLRELLKAAQSQGLTVDELERLTHVGHQSVSARVHELFNGGEVLACGKRPARSGKLATVYVEREAHFAVAQAIARGAADTGRNVSLCSWCKAAPIDTGRGQRFCGKRCRQAAWRLRGRSSLSSGTTAPRQSLHDVTTPGVFDVADPPYPGFAWMYKDQQSYGGEVDHAALVAGLALDFTLGRTRGFALATSSKTLDEVLPLFRERGLRFPVVRVCGWFKPIGVSGATRGAHSTWEPVIVCGGRKLRPGLRDWFDGVAEDLGDGEALRAKTASGGGSDLIGRKPLAWCASVFDWLGMLPGDELRDLFPGSGVITSAWAELSALTQSQLSLSLAAGEERRTPLASLLQRAGDVAALPELG